ncbi:MAG: helix-turn-helix domain-containing protein [Oscillospiraceae bacterium]|nr:helix-turn-helix domain-containing protein [Oscillospiraceae bacterium]
MSIFRIQKSKNYVVMSNYHFRDNRLSLAAKGLLSQMLSLPENWNYSLSGLAAINKEGIAAIRTAIHELEYAGYIVRSRERNEHGQLGAAIYDVYELPQKIDDEPNLNKEQKAEATDNAVPKKQNYKCKKSNRKPTQKKRNECDNKRKIANLLIITELVQAMIDYNGIRSHIDDNGIRWLDTITDIIADILSKDDNTKVRIGKEEYNIGVVKKKYMKLRRNNVEDLIAYIMKNESEGRIKNYPQYIRTSLLNAAFAEPKSRSAVQTYLPTDIQRSPSYDLKLIFDHAKNNVPTVKNMTDDMENKKNDS